MADAGPMTGLAAFRLGLGGLGALSPERFYQGFDVPQNVVEEILGFWGRESPLLPPSPPPPPPLPPPSPFHSVVGVSTSQGNASAGAKLLDILDDLANGRL